jgi:hypothetical protein
MLKDLIRENPIFKVKQKYEYNCGPTSMTYCLSVLGFTADQISLCSPMDHILMPAIGTIPTWFAKIAKANDLSYDDIICKDESKFLDQVMHHIPLGPMILLVNGGHWVAVLEYDFDTDKFIVNDPADEESVLKKWTPRKLLKEAYSEVEMLDVKGYYAFIMKE